MKHQYIPASTWAEGINRRNRECVLAGGEPFLYPELGKLVNMLKVRSQIYTNLKCDVDGYLSVVNRPVAILGSCHVMKAQERAIWLRNASKLMEAGNSLRFHIVKSDGWQERTEFIKQYFKNRITACDDQRSGIKSSGIETNALVGEVSCRNRIYLYGPDGYRYHCVTKMIQGKDRLEHISEPDSDDWTMAENCAMFGQCVGCDNNIEGEVKQLGGMDNEQIII